MAGIKGSGTWGSATVYSIGYSGGYNCPGPFGDGMVSPDRSVTWVSGRGRSGPFGPLAQTLYQARRTAIARMSAECAELGGHGVVGVRLTVEAFSAGGLEFKAIGTAVRAPGARRLRRPFTCDLSGQDFTKLIAAGWVPIGVGPARPHRGGDDHRHRHRPVLPCRAAAGPVELVDTVPGPATPAGGAHGRAADAGGSQPGGAVCSGRSGCPLAFAAQGLHPSQEIDHRPGVAPSRLAVRAALTES